ncbi:F-box protein CPR1 [Linum perenne]
MIGGKDSDNGGGGGDAPYLTEDIVINILQRLPIASCVARFRCVCRSWRTLLSDPNFIRRIIFSQSSDDRNSLQVLVTGIPDISGMSSLLYSVYSYETLLPITEESVTPMAPIPNVLVLVGCCDGIFCLTYTKSRNPRGNFVHNTVLWNPTTSETKILPPGPFHPGHATHISLYVRNERIGFGFDPQTEDYKVVRVLEFDESMSTYDEDQYDFDLAEFYHGPLPLVFAEVYSLRNNSWKTLDVDNNHIYDILLNGNQFSETVYLHQQWHTSRNEKCYWFQYYRPHVCAIVSFDMSTELFELVTFPEPSGLTHHDENAEDIGDPFENHVDAWSVNTCFMLKKGVVMVTFSSHCFRCGPDTRPDDETWVLLKWGVAESWTKLVAFQVPNYIRCLEVWKDGTYICAGGDMFVCDITTGEALRKRIEINGTIGWFQARIFKPTRVSMSLG